jgi:hypothetical protein
VQDLEMAVAAVAAGVLLLLSKQLQLLHGLQQQVLQQMPVKQPVLLFGMTSCTQCKLEQAWHGANNVPHSGSWTSALWCRVSQGSCKDCAWILC